MASEIVRRSPARRPRHPGKLLRDTILPATGRTKTDIADLLGISRQTLYDILEERQSITPAMAVRLGKLFGNSPQFWMNMQTNHDLWAAEREIDVSGIPTLRVA